MASARHQGQSYVYFLVWKLFIYLSDPKWASHKGLGSVAHSSEASGHPPLTTDDETQLHMF